MGLGAVESLELSTRVALYKHHAVAAFVAGHDLKSGRLGLDGQSHDHACS